MGPSAKFVSRINGSFPPKKIMGQFFICKNTKPGGSREVWQITRLFRIFFVKPSLIFLPSKCSIQDQWNAQRGGRGRQVLAQESFLKFCPRLN